MIGTRLGPWVLERQLGRGGMGTVFLARREGAGEALPDRAAVKVLAPELAQAEGFLKRFQREIDILRQLDHPHIVRFLGSGERHGHFYFAMEYVDGPSYETLCKEQGLLPWREVLTLALQVAPALKHAHDRGIVHRDLKPSNLLRAADLNGDGPQVMLTDFGIASLFAGRHLTVTGAVVGTAEYLSPEQAAGKPATKRSDLYSLGVVLYTLITGRTPFEGETLAVLHKHRYGQFDLPSRFVPDLPPDFEAIICQLMEKDPSARIPDGAILHRRLDSLRRKLRRQAAGEDIPPARPPSEGEERTKAARLMSRLMREELHRQNAGGPVRRFFNQPWVIVPLFLLTLGLIVWAFWPPSAESLYRQGAELMQSDDPADWERAWEEYLGPLEERFPDHPYQEELAGFRSQLEAGRSAKEAARRAWRAARAGPMTEAEWFYQRGLRLRQEGDEGGAREVWRALVSAFGEVPSEKPWVQLAEKELARKGKEARVARQWDPVRQAMEKARELEKEGKPAGAREIREGLKALYGDDPGARKVLGKGR
jgi:hypothetical protein